MSDVKSSARPGRVRWCSAAGGAETTSFNLASGYFHYTYTNFSLMACLPSSRRLIIFDDGGESSFRGERIVVLWHYLGVRCHMTVAHHGWPLFIIYYASDLESNDALVEKFVDIKQQLILIFMLTISVSLFSRVCYQSCHSTINAVWFRN